MDKRRKPKTNPALFLADQSGAVAIIVAFLITVFLAVAAFAIDYGYFRVARTEAQRTADAAALAGARQMGHNLRSGQTYSDNVSDMALKTAEQNFVAGQAPVTKDLDTKIGKWEPTSRQFAETTVKPDAVQAVMTRKEGPETGGAIGTFFGRILGVNKVNTDATGVAALSGVCEKKPTIPLGIGMHWFTNIGANRGCTQIALNKTDSSCAGWTSLGTNDNAYKGAEEILTGKQQMPLVHAGTSVPFKGGVKTGILDALTARFNDRTYDVDNKTFNADGSVKTWNVSVVVYDDTPIYRDNNCGNPNGTYEIKGFAKVKITGFIETGNDKGPVGVVQCYIVEEGRGGCFYAGVYGEIPGLVNIPVHD